MIRVQYFIDRMFSLIAREYLPISKVVVVVLIASAASFCYRTSFRSTIDRYESKTLSWRSDLQQRFYAKPVTPRPATDGAWQPAVIPPPVQLKVFRASDRLNMLILWIVSGVLFLSVLTTGAIHTLVRLLLLAIMFFLLSIFLFLFWGLAINLVYPMALIAASFPILTIYHQVIIFIERHHLMHLVTKDSLTLLYNYAHFKVLLQGEIQGMDIGHKKHLSLLMIDIDFFKAINDEYGHAAGDEVIRGIADLIRVNCRSLDVACRYGGEEFLLLLPGATPDDAGRVAEKIRKAIQSRKFYLGDHKKPQEVTASFGVATYYPKESTDSIVQRADRALYKAKAGGRNMVCRA